GLWRDSDQVRLQMFGHDLNYKHSANFLKKHPNVAPAMRSILLNWLIEVCEAYTLHRQTFYLAQDYFDRFMMTQSNVQKDVLQLIGITCLFIAAKMEESHPPRLRQMVYVTADTYSEKHIIQMELAVLKHLRWQLTPETPLSWMNLFFQLSANSNGSDLLERQFPLDFYLQMTRLLDLCMLSINALDFRYEVLAASVLCYFVPQERVEAVTGLPKHVIQPCVTWMAPFAQSASRFGKETLKDFAGKKIEDGHTIQTHTDYLTMLVSVRRADVWMPGCHSHRSES
uniref:G2/mitotic-specific cyclin-B2 n=1 Tax=Salarias fasciatus TaxID=181472 RepID=A0A672GVQ3_SALFA